MCRTTCVISALLVAGVAACAPGTIRQPDGGTADGGYVDGGPDLGDAGSQDAGGDAGSPSGDAGICAAPVPAAPPQCPGDDCVELISIESQSELEAFAAGEHVGSLPGHPTPYRFVEITNVTDLSPLRELRFEVHGFLSLDVHPDQAPLETTELVLEEARVDTLIVTGTRGLTAIRVLGPQHMALQVSGNEELERLEIPGLISHRGAAHIRSNPRLCHIDLGAIRGDDCEELAPDPVNFTGLCTDGDLEILSCCP